MTRTELHDLLTAGGFTGEPKKPGVAETWRHADGRWVAVDYVRDWHGVSSDEVRSVTVHPADGGYPDEYRQHFAPTLADLLRQGRI